MTYRFSELIEKYKTQAQFDKWVEARKKEIKELAYENRNIIDKRQLEHELDCFDSVKKVWKPMKTLRRKSEDYDVSFGIDKKGFSRFVVYFPISEKELDKAIEYRQERIKELGKWGSACISGDEAVWDVTHERIYKTFDFTRPITNMQGFEKYGSNLVRKMEIFGFK